MPVVSFFSRNDALVDIPENTVERFASVAVKAGETLDLDFSVCVRALPGATAINASLRINELANNDSRVSAFFRRSTAANLDFFCASASYKTTAETDTTFLANVVGSKTGTGDIRVEIY